MINLNNLLIIEIVSIMTLFLSIITEYRLLNIISIGINVEFINTRFDIFKSNVLMLTKIKNPESIIFLYNFTFITVISFLGVYLNTKSIVNIFYVNIYLAVSLALIISHFYVQYKNYLKYAKRFLLTRKNGGDINMKEFIHSFLTIIKIKDLLNLNVNVENIFNLNNASYVNYLKKCKLLKKQNELINITPLDKLLFDRLISKFDNYHFFIMIESKIVLIEKELDKIDNSIKNVSLEYNSMFYALYKFDSEYILKLGMYIEVITFFIILNILIFIVI